MERELKRYNQYGITSQVWAVKIMVTTIHNQMLTNAKGIIYYADVLEEEIPELLRRDLKKQKYKVLEISKIKLGIWNQEL